MPETSFTRTISNPEVVMKRRRQQKLEKRMQEFMSSDGRPDSGKRRHPGSPTSHSDTFLREAQSLAHLAESTDQMQIRLPPNIPRSLS